VSCQKENLNLIFDVITNFTLVSHIFKKNLDFVFSEGCTISFFLRGYISPPNLAPKKIEPKTLRSDTLSSPKLVALLVTWCIHNTSILYHI
jgi:hypothetical protein